ncbi:MAG: hypothetical protein HYU52_07865 [Acidobacteria bacterium]|nr:hypothetical protein [Acidobacteriota bacterium]
MKIWPVCLSTLVTLAIAGGVFAQAGFTMSSQPPTCLSSLCGKGVIRASVAGEVEPQSVRLYFRAGSEAAEYYIDMLKGAEGYEAIVPAPLRETTSIVYRVVAIGPDGSISSTEPVTVPVTTDCQLAPLDAEQTATSTNLILGLTEVGQTGAPIGFSCAGITKVVGVDLTMSPNNACEEVRLAKGDPCLAPVGREQRGGTGLLGAAALGAAVVTGAVIIENNDDDREPASPSRP